MKQCLFLIQKRKKQANRVNRGLMHQNYYFCMFEVNNK
jgi:hypothetical protein